MKSCIAGDGCVIGEGSQLNNCVLMRDVVIGSGYVCSCVLVLIDRPSIQPPPSRTNVCRAFINPVNDWRGYRCKLQHSVLCEGVVLEDNCVLSHTQCGPGVRVEAGANLHGEQLSAVGFQHTDA